MRNNIPYRDASGSGSNPAIAGLLLSSQMRALMFERGEIAQAIWYDEVAKRTARLARSGRVETFRGGRLKDRWKVRLTVGGSEAPHGLGHTYGHKRRNKAGEITAVIAGAHELNRVLNGLGQL